MCKEHEGLEEQLFSWNGWDSIDTGDFYFYKVVLKVDIGEHKAGDEFSSASFMMSKSQLEFYNENCEVVSTHKLKISAE